MGVDRGESYAADRDLSARRAAASDRGGPARLASGRYGIPALAGTGLPHPFWRCRYVSGGLCGWSLISWYTTSVGSSLPQLGHVTCPASSTICAPSPGHHH